MVASLPWKTIMEGVPTLVSNASDLVRSFRGSNDKEAAGLIPAKRAANSNDAAIEKLEQTVAGLEADLRQAAIIVEGLAESHAAVAAKLQQTRTALLGTSALAGLSIFLSLFALLSR